MSNAENLNPNTEPERPEFSEFDVWATIIKYRPYIRKCAVKIFVDPKDLEQEVCLKVLRVDWNKIPNKTAYLVTIIRNASFDLIKKNSVYVLNLDEDKFNSTSYDQSDNGKWCEDLIQRMDLEKKRKLLKTVFDEFSDDEQQLLNLNFVENLPPVKIAKMLGLNSAEVSRDCNRVKAKLRSRIKKKIGDLI